MTKTPAWNWLIALIAGLSLAPELRAGTTVLIQPISSSGTHTVIGNDIFLPAGPQRVRMEIRLAGWLDEQLKAAQITADFSGFDNGSAPLTRTQLGCPSNNSTGHSFCAQNLEAGSRCQVGCSPGSTVGCHCEWGFQNTLRPDYVAFGFSNISAVDTASENPRYGMTLEPFDFVPDEGVSFYLGTIFLDIPAGAQGVYQIGIDGGETFLLKSPSGMIPIDLYTGARIIIGSPVPPGIRYAAFEPDEPGELTAVRVTLTSLYHPGPPVADGEDRDFSALEGQPRWLGPPATFPDNAPDSTFKAAQLQCTPHFADWGALDVVQIFGDAIIPSSVYTIRQIPISCQANPNDPLCFGPAQIVHTGQWGDAAAPFARSDQPAQPDMADITKIVDAFRGLVGAAPKSLTQLRGVVPNPATIVNFLDVNLAVGAFRGMPYPGPLPASCP